MAQTFLNAGKDGLVVTGLHVDHTVGGEACLRQCRREKIGSRNDPENLALGAGRNSGSEEGGRRAVDGSVTAACDFVEGAKCQARTRKARVDVGDPERKRRFDAPASAFDLFDLRAQ